MVRDKTSAAEEKVHTHNFYAIKRICIEPVFPSQDTAYTSGEISEMTHNLANSVLRKLREIQHNLSNDHCVRLFPDLCFIESIDTSWGHVDGTLRCCIVGEHQRLHRVRRRLHIPIYPCQKRHGGFRSQSLNCLDEYVSLSAEEVMDVSLEKEIAAR